jgi:hypothetical protein
VRTWLTGSALLGASLAASVALAEPRDAGPQNAVSYEPLAILSRGFLIQYERLVTDRIGVVLGPGVRFAARQDFASETLVVHTEGRYWLVRHELISKERGMVGPFAALSANLARTSLESLSLQRSLGAMWAIQESVRFGYRFVIFGFQEITPSFGLGMVHEFDEDGRLAATTRLTLGANLTVGWLF